MVSPLTPLQEAIKYAVKSISDVISGANEENHEAPQLGSLTFAH